MNTKSEKQNSLISLINGKTPTKKKADCYRIVHFSDIHAGIFSWGNGLFDKRLLGKINQYLRRKRFFNAEYLQKAAKLFKQIQADFFVCTGDLTSVGSPEEFSLAEELLHPILEIAGDNFLYVPGNHDAYCHDEKCKLALQETFYRLNRGRFQLSELPVSFYDEEVEFVLCNAAMPKAFFSSNGEIGQEAWKELKDMLMQKKETAFRILLQHFPYLDRNGKRLSWRRRLKRDKELLQLHKDNFFDHLLCGHIHQAFTLQLPSKKYAQAICCAGSISLYGDFLVVDLNSKTKKSYIYNVGLVASC